MVSKPELVEYSDVNSNDPKLLIGLKSLRNSIPIPPHWSLKRDYLQNKRGIEKAEYKLPSELKEEREGKERERERIGTLDPREAQLELSFENHRDGQSHLIQMSMISVGLSSSFEEHDIDLKFLLAFKSRRVFCPDHLSFPSILYSPVPGYIADTGIATMKDALKEKEADQSLKSKTRERVQPKMGKIDIDYQKLHDAFFRFQTAPKTLTPYGEVYYEGKENEIKSFNNYKPGELSKELTEALSIPNLAPPPWLIAMQRFGPPPNYPGLKIKGLNAPIPDGAQWGYHPGGWGRPPMNEFGQPIFPEVMGNLYQQQQDPNGFINPSSSTTNGIGEAEEEKPLWGELEEDDEEEESEEEEEEEDGQGGREEIGDGLETPLKDGLETPRSDSGVHSVTSTLPGGLETPGFMELRKDVRSGAARSGDVQDDQDDGPKELYQVIQEREQSLNGQGMMGSDRIYDLSSNARRAGVSGNAPPVLGREERGTKVSQRKSLSETLPPSLLRTTFGCFSFFSSYQISNPNLLSLSRSLSFSLSSNSENILQTFL